MKPGMKLFVGSAVLAAAALTGSGCALHQSSNDHYQQLPSTQERALTLGLVQSRIHQGMTGGDVASILGSPNIVSSNPDGGEAWIYDKIARDVAWSQSDAGMIGVMGGAGGGIGGVGVGAQSGSSGAASSTERSLTVVINYDAAGRVSDVKYHQSRF